MTSVPSKVQNLVGQIRNNFFRTAKEKFLSFLGFGQVAYKIGQLLRFSVFWRRLDRVKNGFADERILSKDVSSSPKKLIQT